MEATFSPTSPSRGKGRLSDRISRSRRLNRSYIGSASDDTPVSEASTAVACNKSSTVTDRRDEVEAKGPVKSNTFRRQRSLLNRSLEHPHDESPMKTTNQRQLKDNVVKEPASPSKKSPPSAKASSRFAERYRSYQKLKMSETRSMNVEAEDQEKESPATPTQRKRVQKKTTTVKSVTPVRKASSPSKSSYVKKSSTTGSPMSPARLSSSSKKHIVSPATKYLAVPTLSSHDDEKSPVRDSDDTLTTEADFKEPVPKSHSQSIPWPNLSSSGSDECSANERRGIPLPSSIKKVLAKQSPSVFSASPGGTKSGMEGSPRSASPIPLNSSRTVPSPFSSPVREHVPEQNKLAFSSPVRSRPVQSKVSSPTPGFTAVSSPVRSFQKPSSNPPSQSQSPIVTSPTKFGSPPPNKQASSASKSRDDSFKGMSPIEQARAKLRKTKEPEEPAHLTPFQQARARLEAGANAAKASKAASEFQNRSAVVEAEEDEELKNLTPFQRNRIQMEKKSAASSSFPMPSSITTPKSSPQKRVGPSFSTVSSPARSVASREPLSTNKVIDAGLIIPSLDVESGSSDGDEGPVAFHDEPPLAPRMSPKRAGWTVPSKGFSVPNKSAQETAPGDGEDAPDQESPKKKWGSSAKSVVKAQEDPGTKKWPATQTASEERTATTKSHATELESEDTKETTKPMSVVAQARAQLLASPSKRKQQDEPKQLSAFEQARAVASANCKKNEEKCTPGEAKPLTPFEQAKLKAENMEGKNRKKVFSPVRPRPNANAKRNSLGSPPTSRPATTTLQTAYKGIIPSAQNGMAESTEPTEQDSSAAERSKLPEPRQQVAMGGRFITKKEKKPIMPQMYFAGTPPQTHGNKSRAMGSSSATPKLNQELRQFSPSPVKLATSPRSATDNDEVTNITTQLTEESKGRQLPPPSFSIEDIVKTSSENLAVFQDNECDRTSGVLDVTTDDDDGDDGKFDHISHGKVAKAIVSVTEATDTSLEKIEVLNQSVFDDESVPLTPRRLASRPWTKDLVAMSPTKSMKDFTGPRMEKLKSSSKSQSFCDSGASGEEKKSDSGDQIGSSLSEFAAMSIHAVDFDALGEGPKTVILSSTEEDDSQANEGYRNSVSSKALTQASSKVAKRGDSRADPAASSSGSSSSLYIKQPSKAVFGEPSTFEFEDSSKPKVSELADALANWQGGRSNAAKKKPTFTSHAQDILASGDGLVEALERSKSHEKVRTVQDLANDMQAWNVESHSSSFTNTKSDNFNSFEWMNRDPTLENANISVDHVVTLDRTKSRLSPSDAYENEINELKSWLDDKPTAEKDGSADDGAWGTFPSQGQIDKAIDPFAQDNNLTFSKATGGDKATFDPVWDTGAFDNDFFAGDSNPFAQTFEPFDRQPVESFTAKPSDQHDLLVDAFDEFWSSSSGQKIRGSKS